jgi:AmpD protein
MSKEVRVRIGADHWLEGAARCESSNSDERFDADDIALLVIHNISLPPGEFGGDQVRRLFTNCLDCGTRTRGSPTFPAYVSAHLFVDRQGTLTQFVAFDRRAWHAGNPAIAVEWDATTIRLVSSWKVPITFRTRMLQYAALADVAALLIRRYQRLSLDAVVGHQEIAPGRKSDPDRHSIGAALSRMP